MMDEAGIREIRDLKRVGRDVTCLFFCWGSIYSLES